MQCSSVDTDQHAQEYKGTWRLDDKVIWPILCKLGDILTSQPIENRFSH